MIVTDEYDQPLKAVQEGMTPQGSSVNQPGRTGNFTKDDSPQEETTYVISGGLDTCNADRPNYSLDIFSTEGRSTEIKQQLSEADEITLQPRSEEESRHLITMPSSSRSL